MPVSKIKRLDVQEWLRFIPETSGKTCLTVPTGKYYLRASKEDVAESFREAMVLYHS